MTPHSICMAVAIDKAKAIIEARKLLDTITAWDSRVERLSDEVYQVMYDDSDASDDMTGQYVRLISGVDKNPAPGYHFSPGYSTVCRVDADCAQFIGIKTKSLKLIGDKNDL